MLLAALAWWLVGRAVVALTWRDERLLGPFGSEAIATLVALGVVLVALVMAWRSPVSGASSAALAAAPDRTGGSRSDRYRRPVGRRTTGRNLSACSCLW